MCVCDSSLDLFRVLSFPGARDNDVAALISQSRKVDCNMTDDTVDYYAQKPLHPGIWHEKWFDMFKVGNWMNSAVPTEVSNPQYDFYHPYACHSCKRGSLQQMKLLQCTGCRLVKYCCREHQKDDWKNHKQWCKAFKQVGDSGGDPTDLVSWRNYSMKVNDRMRRTTAIELHSVEIQIAAMQPRCRRCFTAGAKSNDIKLVVCPKCSGVAVCEACLGDEESRTDWNSFHPDVNECNEHRLALCCTGMIIENGCPLLSCSDTNCETLFQPSDWFDYFQEKRNDMNRGTGLPMERLSLMAPVSAFLTDGLSMPLTVHHILSLLGVEDRSRLVLHLVGASTTETLAQRVFVELARLNPHLKYLRIYLIGPGVPEVNDVTLAGCLSEPEAPVLCKGGIKTIEGLYHDVVAADNSVEPPDLIVAYNAGITEPTHFLTWAPTLTMIRKTGSVPFCITGYNHAEVVDDVGRLESLGLHAIIPPTPNPFRGLQPSLDPVRDPSDFIYSNASFAVLRGDTV